MLSLLPDNVKTGKGQSGVRGPKYSDNKKSPMSERQWIVASGYCRERQSEVGKQVTCDERKARRSEDPIPKVACVDLTLPRNENEPRIYLSIVMWGTSSSTAARLEADWSI